MVCCAGVTVVTVVFPVTGDVLFCGVVRRFVVLLSLVFDRRILSHLSVAVPPYPCAVVVTAGCLRWVHCHGAVRSDGGVDITWGCNRVAFANCMLPAGCAFSTGGGCFPVISVCGGARVEVLQLQPALTLVRIVQWVLTDPWPQLGVSD